MEKTSATRLPSQHSTQIEPQTMPATQKATSYYAYRMGSDFQAQYSCTLITLSRNVLQGYSSLSC